MRRSLTAFLALVVVWASAIEHDSLCNDDDVDCPEPVHVVMRLLQRDDARAAVIAEQHNMRVVGRPFNDSQYFIKHLESTRSREHKREIIERLKNARDVEWVKEQRSRGRVKRPNLEDEAAETD